MPGSLKTEAIVLRGIKLRRGRPHPAPLYPASRAGERDREGRAPRAQSRFGGRLEPFFRLDLVLYEGRSDLLTVTSAETLAGHPRLREDARLARRRRPRLRRRRPACSATATRTRASTTCSPTSSRCWTPSRRAPTPRQRSSPSGSSCCSPAGFAPQLAACASCGEREHLVGFSGARRRRRLRRLRGERVPARAGGARLPRRRARPPAGRGAGRRAARAAQAERAIAETLEHHAHVSVRPAARPLLDAPRRAWPRPRDSPELRYGQHPDAPAGTSRRPSWQRGITARPTEPVRSERAARHPECRRPSGHGK